MSTPIALDIPHQLGKAAAYERLDRSRRHGSEIWQPLLLLLLGLMFGEVFLQQRIAKA